MENTENHLDSEGELGFGTGLWRPSGFDISVGLRNERVQLLVRGVEKQWS